ncbi:Huntingtin [Halotydeus destructor]|nr:Huntingtin [Halotydeus destructor]
MASLDKLIKSLEALKIAQNSPEKLEEAFASAKFISGKKDASAFKKDKITHCSAVSEHICNPNLKTIEDFPKYLSITIETLLHFCNDQEADVRLNSSECLNRIIRCLADQQLGRIQVELYKEIKKNGPSRCLRAALSRFSELCHMIKHSKRRPFLTNLIPCIIKLSTRTDEEDVQETLSQAMVAMMPIFAKYASESEISTLLKSFSLNLNCNKAPIRRSAANAIGHICSNSKKPVYFSTWLLNILLSNVSQVRNVYEASPPCSSETNISLLIGLFEVSKAIIPILSTVSLAGQGDKLSSQMSSKQREQAAQEESLALDAITHLYELILTSIITETDHTVTLNALEALQILLKNLSEQFFVLIADETGITKSKLGEYVRSPSVLSSPSSSRKIKQSSISLDNVSNLADEDDLVIRTKMNQFGVTSSSEDQESEMEDISSRYGHKLQTADTSMSVDSVRSDENSSTPTGPRSLRKPFMTLTYIEQNEDSVSPSPTVPSNQVDSDFKFEFTDCSIGEFTTPGIASIEFCTRVICTKFLLTGSKEEDPGVSLISDQMVRVSLKAIALNCLSTIVTKYPKSFLLHLNVELEKVETPSTEGQKVWHVLSYSKHPDPHLRGQVSHLVASYLGTVLASTTSYTNFLLANCSLGSFSEAPSVDELLTSHLFQIVLDSDQSPSAIRSGLSAASNCIRQLMLANEGIGHVVLGFLRQVLKLKNHNYWLIKTELLSLFTKLSFKDMHYIEQVNRDKYSRTSPFGRPLQDDILDIVLDLLSDTDHRIRSAAVSCLVIISRHLFLASDYPDGHPVTALAVEQLSHNLPSYTLEQKQVNSKSSFPTQPLPKNFGFAPPFCSSSEHIKSGQDSFVERILELIVGKLVTRLRKNVSSKNHVSGIVVALDSLLNEFPLTLYPKSWSLEANNQDVALNLVELLLSLTASPTSIVLDVTFHGRLLSVISKLMSGLSYVMLRSSADKIKSLSEVEDQDFGILSIQSKQLASHADKLANHVFKLLKLYHCTIEKLPLPVTSQPGEKSGQPSGQLAKSSIPSLSSATLSPLRKKLAPEKSSLLNFDSSDQIKCNFQDDGSDFVYMKLHEVLKSVYANHRTILDRTPSKFVCFAQSIMSSLNQILEICTLRFIGSRTQEILDTLKSLIVINPLSSVECVRQLLKAIFGTNFIMLMSLNISEQNRSTLETDVDVTAKNRLSARSSRGFSVSGSIRPYYGLYQTCISNPYMQMSQELMSQSSTEKLVFANLAREEQIKWQLIMRRTVEKRVASLLDKSLTASNPKNQISSYIRAFEPIVIKALKLYTMTTDSRLQVGVLDLLSELVKLRVNYSLLDSEQVFLGFVFRQFEQLETGHSDSTPEDLLASLFDFLVLLSYERIDSQPIVAVSKIIQLIDGILASGQNPNTHALPSLSPVVNDLFCLRNSTRTGESAKELEAQKEVLMSALLKVSSYSKSIELLTVIVSTSARESEEKHRKISRLLMDAITPSIARQVLRLDNYPSVYNLDMLYQSLNPTVFRPVDTLLKALLAPPRDDVLTDSLAFNRWFAGTLILLKTLIVHGKEETILIRLDELTPSLLGRGAHGLYVLESAFRMAESYGSSDIPEALDSVDLLAEFFLQVALLGVTSLVKNIELGNLVTSKYSAQLLANYILHLTHMFQSGSFRRVAKAASAILKNQAGSVDVNYLNESFKEIEIPHPPILIQWANLLILLGFDDFGTHQFWYNMVKRDDSNETTESVVARPFATEPKTCHKTTPSSIEMVKRATLVLLCDFIAENILADAEQMAWLLVNNVQLVVTVSYELPVKEFVSAVHRKPASSGLFLQAVSTRCEEALTKPVFLKKLLPCLEYVHPVQSGSLITFLVERIIVKRVSSIARTLASQAEDLAISRIEMIIQSDSIEEMVQQMTKEDVDKLLDALGSKCPRLIRSLKLLRSAVSDDPESVSVLRDNSPQTWTASREWFLSMVKQFCANSKHHKHLATVLNRLPHEDINHLLKEVPLQDTCLNAGYISMMTAPNNGQFAASSSSVLYKAAAKKVFEEIEQLEACLPREHYPVLGSDELMNIKEENHRNKLFTAFRDAKLLEHMTSLSSAIASYVTKGLTKLTTEQRRTVLRVVVVYFEALIWSTEHYHIEQIEVLLKVCRVLSQSKYLLELLALEDNVSLLESVVYSMNVFVKLVKEVPTVSGPWAAQDVSQLTHAQQSCIRMSEMVQWLDTYQGSWSELGTLRLLIISVARLPLVNSFTMVPPIAWKSARQAKFEGISMTKCPTTVAEDLGDVESLKEFISRIKLIGWTSRVQFEEFWMSLLGVVSHVQASDEDSEVEHVNEMIEIACLAVTGMSELLTLTLSHPVAGHPVQIKSSPLVRRRHIAFLHTKYGEHYSTALTSLEKVEQLEYEIEKNLISIEYLRKAIGEDLPTPETPTSPSLSSESDSLASSISQPSPKKQEMEFELDKLPHRTSLEVDLKSCVRFLIDLYSQLITTNQWPPLSSEVYRSLVLVSDLFFERQQFEWMLNVMLEMYKNAVNNEDEIQIRHLVLGICKCAAVLRISDEQNGDKLRKCIENGLKSSFLPSRVATLRGLMYVLEQRETISGSLQIILLPIASEYLMSHLSEPSLPSSKNVEHALNMWTLAFQLIENFVDDFTESEFSQSILTVILKMITDDELPTIKRFVLNKLERLIILEVFSIKDAGLIVRTALDRIRNGSLDEVLSYRLVVASMYLFGMSIGNESNGDEVDSSEELLAAMEKVSTIFDRLKVCSPQEAETICHSLPMVLIDFFPSQNILNKIIGELLSAQQLYPEHLSLIVFKVFGNLLTLGQVDELHDWVLLSVLSFTQLEPLSLAVWSLTVFLVSASANEWIRALYPCIRHRLGKMEDIDKQVLSVVAASFYSELKTETNREQFMSTLVSVAANDNIYQQIVTEMKSNL